MRKAIYIAALVLFGALNLQAQSPLANVGGKVYASGYARWHVTVVTAPVGTGAGSITVTPGIPSNQDGSQVTNAFVSPGGGIYTPITVGLGTANQETVTPTAVSGCNAGSTSPATCTLTATFANTHGPGDIVVSGDAGIQEAMNSIPNGGVVVVDNTASATDANITSTIVNPKIAIEDARQTAEQWWTPVGGTTAIAAPAVLTNTTVTNSTTPAGSYTNANAYVICVAYVDIMGQEGQCSPTFSQTPTAASGNSFTITAPVASTGAVGYTVYISLTNGTYQLAYKVPLVTQPTATGAYPVANGVCTLTTVETITPACSVANTVYGTTAASATVTALTLNTSPIDPQVTIVSTTSVYVPNAGGRTTYTYAPGARAGIVGTVGESLPFTISAADTTTTPSVIGTINMRPGFMNYIGKAIRVCGKATTTASTATITSIQFQWDAMGQNTAGKGVQIGSLTLAPPVAFATTAVYGFCEDFVTTVAGASATAGSINTEGGWVTGIGTAAAGTAGAGSAAAGNDPTIGTTASLNLSDDARLNVIYVHTTGTDGAAITLQGLTVTELN
jgi:hypothetical protein